ncbi:MAG: WXG100 family type VII secretion target [Actinocatenispora sp.]
MTIFNTETPEMQAAATKADDSGGQISGSMARLMRELEALPGGFQGEAAQMFQQAKNEMHRNLVEITDALNDMAEGIRTAGRDFDASDQESAQEVNRAVADALRGN